MRGQIIAKTESCRYIVKPDDSNIFESVPFEKFHVCIFPDEMLDDKGLLKEGVVLQLVRVSNGWIYPNHRVYKPLLTI